MSTALQWTCFLASRMPTALRDASLIHAHVHAKPWTCHQ